MRKTLHMLTLLEQAASCWESRLMRTYHLVRMFGRLRWLLTAFPYPSIFSRSTLRIVRNRVFRFPSKYIGQKVSYRFSGVGQFKML